MLEPYLRPKKLLNFALTAIGIGFVIAGPSPFVVEHFPNYGKMVFLGAAVVTFIVILAVDKFMPD